MFGNLWGNSFTKFIKLESVPLYLWQISQDDSMSNQQLRIGFSKSWKLLEFVFRQVTLNEPQSCDKFNLFKIMAAKNTISRRCDKYWDSLSSLNLDQDYSIGLCLTGRNIFQNVLLKGTFCILLKEYSELLTEINLKDTADMNFCRIYKNKIVFCTNGGAEQCTNTFLSKSIDN